MSNELVKVATLDELGTRGLHVVQHDGKEVLLCRAGSKVYAVDNLCSHAAEKLCNGKLKSGKLICPLHGAAFDIRTGNALSRPASQPLATYPVVVEGDSIYLEGPS